MDYEAMDALRINDKEKQELNPQYSMALKDAQLIQTTISSNNLLNKQKQHLIEKTQSCHNLLMMRKTSFKRFNSEQIDDAEHISPAPLLPTRSTTNLLINTQILNNNIADISDYSTLPNGNKTDFCLLKNKQLNDDYSMLSKKKNSLEKNNIYSDFDRSYWISQKNVINLLKNDYKIDSNSSQNGIVNSLNNDYKIDSYKLKNSTQNNVEDPRKNKYNTKRPLIAPKPNLLILKLNYFNPERIKWNLINELRKILQIHDARELAIMLSEEDCKCFYSNRINNKVRN